MEQIYGEKPTPTTFRQKRKGKYGDCIVFSTVRTLKTVVCFRDESGNILNGTWHTSKSSNEKTEQKRFVQTADALLLEDMQLMTYGSTVCPPRDDFFCDSEDMVP
ncbi:hypothetical protein AVEN_137335-1 [Araneus ventricosus]|uniref:Uncharacterized protein n=1 Tax=Araneus ventricosus TaxID=182803 RepID=A0A4Y2FMH7_ARAVE|nr:hypothetical protein AVEN_137335-1 [Araneus ventricosus]